MILENSVLRIGAIWKRIPSVSPGTAASEISIDGVRVSPALVIISTALPWVPGRNRCGDT